MSQITRFNDFTTQDVVFTTSINSTGGFGMGVYSGAMLLVTGTSTNGALTLTFRVGVPGYPATGENSLTAADATNTLVTMTVQPLRAYPLPDALFAASYICATTSAGTVTCRVLFKG